MIPGITFTPKQLDALQQAYQGPQRPTPMWMRVCAFAIRGACYVIASPMLAFVGVVCLILWAFMLEE